MRAGAEKLAIGYFRANSTALCAVEDCSILSPLLLKTLLALRDALAAGALPPRIARNRGVRRRERCEAAAYRHVRRLPRASGGSSRNYSARSCRKSKACSFTIPARERMELDGPGFLEYKAARSTYRVGHFSFFQVNRFLVRRSGSRSRPANEAGQAWRSIFSPAWGFSRCRSQEASATWWPSNRIRRRRAISNRTHARAQRIEVRTADVEQLPREIQRQARPDRPRSAARRTGARRHEAALAHRARAHHLRFLRAAHAGSRSRRAHGGGYEISAIHLFDLFPQTFHMETVVRLRRSRETAMKLPALWIAAAFAAGIAIATRWPGPLKLWLAGAVAAMLLGAILLWRESASGLGTRARRVGRARRSRNLASSAPPFPQITSRG